MTLLEIALLQEGPLGRTVMLKPRITLNGQTGKTGSVVVSELLKACYPGPHHVTDTW